MSYVIKTALSNPKRPECGQITVFFPIPMEQYDQTIEMLQTIGLELSVDRDCNVDQIDCRYSVLDTIKDTLVNADQLDYLAKRLDSFTKGETAQFQAMAHKLELVHIKDFINLTFDCQQATVITDFSDLEKIGRDHMMTLNGGAMPMDQYQEVNGTAEALQLIEGGGGTITPFGVVYDNGMVLDNQYYNGHQFPAYPYDNPTMVLEITSRKRSVEEENPEYLYLPATERQIERALLRIGTRKLSNIQLRIDFDEMPEKMAAAMWCTRTLFRWRNSGRVMVQ